MDDPRSERITLELDLDERELAIVSRAIALARARWGRPHATDGEILAEMARRQLAARRPPG